MSKKLMRKAQKYNTPVLWERYKRLKNELKNSGIS
jgi:hypothetical protein